MLSAACTRLLTIRLESLVKLDYALGDVPAEGG